MKRLNTVCLLVITLGLYATQVSTQGIKQKDLADAWDTMANMVITTAKAMPAEHYDYKPTHELAPFGALVGHTAGANYLFGPTVDAPKVNRPEFDATKKNEVIKSLEASFEYVKDAINQLSDDDLNEEIEWFGTKMSRIKAILGMTDHVQREYGKVITYARLKGIKPAGGRGW